MLVWLPWALLWLRVAEVTLRSLPAVAVKLLLATMAPRLFKSVLAWQVDVCADETPAQVFDVLGG